MKLITEETWDVKNEILVEEATGRKTCFLEGVFMQSGIENRNGRIYPKVVLESQLNAYTEKFIAGNRAYGEFGHPNTPKVNEERLSHIITEMRYANENDVWGKAKVLRSQPLGAMVYGLVAEEGTQLGMSTRGLGSLKRSKRVDIVQNDFLMTAVDVVLDPSAPDAFVNGIMESKEWIIEDGVLVEREVESIQAQVDDAARSTRRTDEEVIKIFEAILQNKGYLNS